MRRGPISSFSSDFPVKKAVAIGLSAAILIGAVVLAVTEHRAGQTVPAAAPVRAAPVDPLAVEMARCQALGEAGARDPGCLAAWGENRRRFLLPDRRPMAPTPIAPKEAVRWAIPASSTNS